jgi:hypothetical protein
MERGLGLTLKESGAKVSGPVAVGLENAFDSGRVVLPVEVFFTSLPK